MKRIDVDVLDKRISECLSSHNITYAELLNCRDNKQNIDIINSSISDLNIQFTIEAFNSNNIILNSNVNIKIIITSFYLKVLST